MSVRECRPRVSQGKRAPRFPKALATLLSVRHRLGHQAPEVRRVAPMGQVGQLVDDDILNKRWRKHSGAPVEAERAIGRATTPALALIAYKHPRPFSLAEPRPPAFNNIRQPLGSPVPIPSDDGAPDALLPFLTFETFRHSHPEPPVVEADLRRAHIPSIDDHAGVASQIWQRLATDEAFRRGLQHLTRCMAEYPGRSPAHDGP